MFILTRQSNKKPSQPTAARSLSEFWQVAMLTASSRSWRGPQGIPKKRPWTAIRGGGGEISAHARARAARLILRGDEKRAGGGPQGVLKKRPWTSIRGGGQDTGLRTALCQTEIEGHGAARWWGPRGVLKKRL